MKINTTELKDLFIKVCSAESKLRETEKYLKDVEIALKDIRAVKVLLSSYIKGNNNES